MFVHRRLFFSLGVTTTTTPPFQPHRYNSWFVFYSSSPGSSTLVPCAIARLSLLIHQRCLEPLWYGATPPTQQQKRESIDRREGWGLTEAGKHSFGTFMRAESCWMAKHVLFCLLGFLLYLPDICSHSIFSAFLGTRGEKSTLCVLQDVEPVFCRLCTPSWEPVGNRFFKGPLLA